MKDITREVIRVSIRNVDKRLWREARVHALSEGQTISQWINEAIREKLSRAKMAKYG